MDIYAYSWLQFVFPFYVLFLIGCIILVCHYSQTMSRLFGQNPVAVLATLLLISYSKMVKALIAPLSYTHLTYSSPNESNDITVWLYDGSVKFFQESKHTVLGLFAVVLFLFVFIPYTFLLFFGHWLYAYSDRWALKWLNKVKPFMDAYYAPFKKQSRYWIGLLLFARGGLFLLFAFNATDDDNDNILVISSVSAALTLMKGRVYEKHYNDVLETFFTLNLCVFSVSTFYLSEKEILGRQDVLSKVSVGVAFMTFIGILVFHAYLQLKLTEVWKEAVGLFHKFFRITPTMNKNSDGINENPTSECITLSVVHLREPLLDSDDF